MKATDARVVAHHVAARILADVPTEAWPVNIPEGDREAIAAQLAGLVHSHDYYGRNARRILGWLRSAAEPALFASDVGAQ